LGETPPQKWFSDSVYLFKQKLGLKSRIAQLRHPFDVIKNLIGNGVIIPESLNEEFDGLIEQLEKTTTSIEDVDNLLTETISIVHLCV